MSTDKIGNLFEADAQSVEDVPASDTMEQSYIDYAMSVIAGRALPDARDGLKPVQRRILYKMDEMNVSSGSAHRKSSSIIGETMGDLHPHGDKAIYDALVRMAQDFSLWGPLVDGQGNFGSMDGDPPAAMRYTEARMSPFAEKLIEDLDKNTVNFTSNYDNRLEEPDVLPSAFPNLFINGSSGIAVGMATDIPPHNLSEIINATVHRIENPESSVSELMEYVKGPDFPTGATIVGREGIVDAYETGNGSVTVRADYEKERENNRIVITEIPYKKQKSKLVQKIAESVGDGRIEGVSDVRDESDREGVRIVIDLKSSANIDVVENQLIDNALEKTVSMNHIALVDGQPKRLSLPQYLDIYIDHRRTVVERRSQYELKQAKDRHHIIVGRQKALKNIDDVIDVIRGADDKQAAVTNLQSEFDLSEDQAEHITRMQLSSLTGLKQEEIQEEKEELESEIEELESVLASQSALDEQIIKELEIVKNEHGRERQTEITNDSSSVTYGDLIAEEDVVVIQTEGGYVKRVPVEEFGTKSRNVKGVYGLNVDDDTIKSAYRFNTHDELLAITEDGRLYDLHGYDIPESTREAHGSNLVNVLDISPDEQVERFVKRPEEKEGKYLVVAYDSGRIDKTDLTEFEDLYDSGLFGLEPAGSKVVDAIITDGDDDIMLTTVNGKAIRFNETDVRATGRQSKGVRGIRLDENDSVSGMTKISDEETVLFTTKTGKGKQTKVSEFKCQSRGGKGVKCVRDISLSGSIQDINAVEPTIILASSNGKVAHIETDDISTQGRTANGVAVMDVGESVVTSSN